MGLSKSQLPTRLPQAASGRWASPYSRRSAVPPNLLVTVADSKSIDVFLNVGNGTFYPPIEVPENGDGPDAVVAGDFAGNGSTQAVVANSGSNDIVLFAPIGVGNTATFLPGSSASSTPASGPTSLEATTNSIALDKLLAQMQSLQGGNTAFLGPFDETSQIAPAGIDAPNFMAYTSLVYPPNQVPLSLNSAGMFLSLTPATLNETAKNANTDLSYTQNGAYLNGWQLLDSNGNPIAASTLLQLFGTPTVNSSGQQVGVNLTPVNPNQPYAAFNGGWYFDGQPVNGAAASWADAFFDWGLGTTSYSPQS